MSCSLLRSEREARRFILAWVCCADSGACAGGGCDEVVFDEVLSVLSVDERALLFAVLLVDVVSFAGGFVLNDDEEDEADEDECSLLFGIFCEEAIFL